MLTLNDFKQEEDKRKPSYKKIAIGLGGLGVINAAPVAITAGTTANRIRKAKQLDKTYTELDKVLKKEQIKNHPDRFVGNPQKQAEAEKKFREVNNQRAENVLKKERNAQYLTKEKGLINKAKGFKRKMGLQVEDEITDYLQKMNPGKKIPKDIINKQLTMAKTGYKTLARGAAGYGVAGLGVLAAGGIANKVRKMRSDKGRKRGSYNT